MFAAVDQRRIDRFEKSPSGAVTRRGDHLSQHRESKRRGVTGKGAAVI